jgi:hypothetical protein
MRSESCVRALACTIWMMHRLLLGVVWLDVVVLVLGQGGGLQCEQLVAYAADFLKVLNEDGSLAV